MNATYISRILVNIRGICLISGIIFLFFSVIFGYSYTLELEMRTPEHEQLEQDHKYHEGQRAYERVQEGKANERDYDKALEYRLENLS